MDRLGNTHFELAPLENQTPQRPPTLVGGLFCISFLHIFMRFALLSLDKAPKIFSIWRHIFKFNP